jgi:general secretion pathway protein G
LRDAERHKRHSHLCPLGCADAWQQGNLQKKKQSLGFTLIELLIVLTLIGMISGVAAPNFWALFTKTMEQRDLDTFSEQLDALRLEAWTTGRSIQLPQGGGKKWPPLPTGWQAEKLPALRFLTTGITNGGQLILSSRSDHRWQIDIRALDGKTTLTQLATAKVHE